jgi:hypothetical protein
MQHLVNFVGRNRLLNHERSCGSEDSAQPWNAAVAATRIQLGKVTFAATGHILA